VLKYLSKNIFFSEKLLKRKQTRAQQVLR